MLDSTTSRTDLRIIHGWFASPDLLPAVRSLFAYGPGEDRATGYLYGEGSDWAPELSELGPKLLNDLEGLTGIRYELVIFQAYRNGSGCDWHTDAAFDAQAVLSLGATRTFGTRRIGEAPVWTVVEHGDLVVMPTGFQVQHEHCVPIEDELGERVSLVFRTVARS